MLEEKIYTVSDANALEVSKKCIAFIAGKIKTILSSMDDSLYTIVEDTTTSFKVNTKNGSQIKVIAYYSGTYAGVGINTGGGDIYCWVMENERENGVYILNFHYIDSQSLFCIMQITRGTAMLTTSGDLRRGFQFSASQDTKFPMIITYDYKWGLKTISTTYGSVTDSWTDVPINGLMNSVMVWPAQYSIYTNPKIFRFKTGAMNFPSIMFSQFGVSGVGDFSILQATKSGEVVSGLAYKI